MCRLWPPSWAREPCRIAPRNLCCAEGKTLALEHGWYRVIRRRILEDIAGYEPSNEKSPGAMTVPGALHLIRKVLPDDGLLISDVGSHKIWIARNFPTLLSERLHH
jgi:thiamine pyrophosphate-dependent acetolactate synthase large subunit-like protein